jgi:hypothetical protein
MRVQAQVNLPEARVARMSDHQLARYDQLLLELRELAEKDGPKWLASVNR